MMFRIVFWDVLIILHGSTSQKTILNIAQNNLYTETSNIPRILVEQLQDPQMFYLAD
jgi:hypothetical protein